MDIPLQRNPGRHVNASIIGLVAEDDIWWPVGLRHNPIQEIVLAVSSREMESSKSTILSRTMLLTDSPPGFRSLCNIRFPWKNSMPLYWRVNHLMVWGSSLPPLRFMFLHKSVSIYSRINRTLCRHAA